jgi:hypothetical protein
MIYEEREGDLFDISDKYFLVNYLSADSKFGGGSFVHRFPEIKVLKNKLDKIGVCKRVDKVLNFVVKENNWQKATYETFKLCLISMKKLCYGEQIDKIAMPVLKELDWEKVRPMINEIFKGMDIEIIVYRKM